MLVLPQALYTYVLATVTRLDAAFPSLKYVMNPKEDINRYARWISYNLIGQNCSLVIKENVAKKGEIIKSKI